MVELVRHPPIGADWTPLQRKIHQYFTETRPRLVANLPGKYGPNATSKEIAAALGGCYTDRKIRNEILLMNIGHRIPIISSGKGFKLAENNSEIRRYAAELKQRAVMELRRAEILLEIAGAE